MNRDADKSAKCAPGRQQQNKKQRTDAQWERRHCDPTEEEQKPAGKAAAPGAELRRSPGAHRKLSDASNASEDLSKDSGCPSAKLSSSDSGSEISDCTSEGNKLDSPGSSDNDLSWIDDKADLSRGGGGGGGEDAADGERRVKAAGRTGDALLLPVDAARLDPGLLLDFDLMMGNTTEDLIREVDELRSENEYLKDEVEELRCEMLEMRDLFQEEEVYQLQELRLQLEQANKTCRVLHYRLRKAERRSIRVAQTGQVDGELVKGLEHDIKVAKSVSCRLYDELEAVQKKNSRLELDNEALREKTQELEVAGQVLQAELDKARENNQRKRSIRSAASKAEKRLSQQLEDDSADLKVQLHFAKEELALMCKKLTKLVSESEAMREELAGYQAAYGDVGAAQSPEGKPKPSRGREAEVRAHLKLVEEEATLLSRRIVELEVENRGLRAEMSDLREKVGGGGGGGGEEEEDEEDGQTAAKDRRRGSKAGGRGEEETSGGGKAEAEDGGVTCHITREGPVGGEWDPTDGGRDGDRDGGRDPGVRGMTGKDVQALLALRDHSRVVSSALQLLTAPPRNGHGSPPADGKTGLSDGLELLQAMLLAFICRAEALLESGGQDVSSPPQKEEAEEDSGVDLRNKEVKLKAELLSSCRDPRMQLCLQVLWILHQWCQVQTPDSDRKEDKSAASVLRDLLRELGETLREERGDVAGEAGVAPGETSEPAVSSVLLAGRPREAERNRVRRQFSPHGAKRSKNWCYLSREAAQLDREDPVKTWDHLIMPLSFPELDLQRLTADRSHTAPEKSVVRIYYSPPSARRVQLAQQQQQQQQSAESDGESAGTPASWCTPLTSFSQLCLGASSSSAANLSDDMKEMTRRGRPAGRWVDVACSGTQTLTGPQMVSVGQQTDAAAAASSTGGARGSPSRVLGLGPAALASVRSLDGIAGRAERTRSSTSSPKLYRRHSASGGPSVPSSSSSSSSSTSRDRTLWSPSQQSHPGLAWTRQSSPRAGGGHGHAKPPSKPAAAATANTANRYGLVSEFLRRVSGRADKPAPPGSAQKSKGVKNLERVPSRPAGVALHRNDSVTRIVNQRFMKQREEAGRGQKEEKGGSSSRRSLSSSSAAEDGNYDCSSSSTLTFCFARPSRSAQRQTSNLGRLQRHRQPPAAATATADSA